MKNKINNQLIKVIKLKNRIKEFRARFDLTQFALSQLVNVSRQTILAIEKGRYNPSIELAFKLSRVFNCRIEDIFFFEDESKQSISDLRKIDCCPICGNKHMKNANFCMICGTKIRL